MSRKNKRFKKKKGGDKPAQAKGQGPESQTDDSVEQEKLPEQTQPRSLSLRKKLFFSAILTLLILATIELVLTLAGVRPVSFESDPYVGFTSQAPLFIEQKGLDGSAVKATAPNKLSFFNKQEFPREKPKNSYRIFCVGGSTTFGRPYDDRTSFCGWLRALLPAADSTRPWELINAGGVSYASYRVAVLMEELIRYEPDLFVIYSGQNEFLENRTYQHIIEQPKALRGLGSLASRTRTYAAVKKTVDALRADSRKTMLSGEVRTRLDDVVGPKDYVRDDALQKKILDHYRFNLMRMVDIARSAGAKVLLVVPASNYRDCSPFKSQHREGLSQSQRIQFKAYLDFAQKAYAQGKYLEAHAALDQAVKIDPRYAHLQYLRGRVLYALKRFDQAKSAFERAIDEDVCPLRALSPMRRIVAAVAAERGIPLVDFAAQVERMSEHGIPGENLFLDHVHPTIDGNRHLALAILNKLVDEKVLSPGPDWNEESIARVAEKVRGGIDDQARGKALLNLSKVIGWAGKQEESEKLAQMALQLMPTNPEIQMNMGISLSNRGDFAAAVPYYRQTLKLRPDHLGAHTNLGVALASTGHPEQALVHFGQASRLLETYGKELEADLGITPEMRVRKLSGLYNNLGLALCNLGRLEEGIERYKQALGQRQDFPEAHNNLGIALTRSRRYDEALEHYYAALRTAPNFFDAHNNLGVTLTNLGHLDEAAKHFTIALRLRPDAKSALDGMERIKRQQAGKR